MHKQPFFLSFLFCGGLSLAVNFPALALELPDIVHPDAKVHSFYNEHKDEIENLMRTVRDASAPVNKRIDAYNVLMDDYPDFAVALSEELLKDTPEEALDTHIVASLSAIIAMDPRPEMVSEGETPYEQYRIELRDRILKTLTDYIGQGQGKAVSEAAGTIASKGYLPGLNAIAVANTNNKISDQEAIDLYSLAPLDRSGLYIERYANSEDLAVKKQSLSYLAYNPEYVGKVRNIALNPDTDEHVVAAVIPGLRTSDNLFSSYMEFFLNEPDKSDEFKATALKEVIAYRAAEGFQDPGVRTATSEFYRKLATTLNIEEAMKAGLLSASAQLESIPISEHRVSLPQQEPMHKE